MTKYKTLLITQCALVVAWIACIVWLPTVGCFVGFAAGYHTYRLKQWRRAMEISR